MKLIDLRGATEAVRSEVWNLYESSFPDYERWGEQAFGRAMTSPAFYPKIATDDDGSLLGLLFYWLYDEVLYIEFLAVHPALRGRKTGSRLIEKLIADNPGRKIVLEIDPPDDEISTRRRGFYERLGFVVNNHEHIHPSYVKGAGAHPHRLVLMSLGEPMSGAEFTRFREFLLGIIDEYGD